MTDKPDLTIAGKNWTVDYVCKKCGFKSPNEGLVMRMFDHAGAVSYEKRYCMRCYILFFENAGIGELEYVTNKGDKK